MKYLLDTCVLSEFVKAAPSAAVNGWMAQQPESGLFVSALSLAELARGVAKLPPSKRKTDLAAWLAQLETSLGERVLPFTRHTASYWGEICASAEAKGQPLAAFDSLIAATAVEHGLVVVTRNVKDFATAPLVVVDPWAFGEQSDQTGN